MSIVNDYLSLVSSLKEFHPANYRIKFGSGFFERKLVYTKG